MELTDNTQEIDIPVEPTYRAFLLRCWCESGVWRYCLLEPGDGQSERGFADLEALVAYLKHKLEVD